MTNRTLTSPPSLTAPINGTLSSPAILADAWLLSFVRQRHARVTAVDPGKLEVTSTLEEEMAWWLERSHEELLLSATANGRSC